VLLGGQKIKPRISRILRILLRLEEWTNPHHSHTSPRRREPIAAEPQPNIAITAASRRRRRRRRHRV